MHYQNMSMTMDYFYLIGLQAVQMYIPGIHNLGLSQGLCVLPRALVLFLFLK